MKRPLTISAPLVSNDVQVCVDGTLFRELFETQPTQIDKKKNTRSTAAASIS